MAIEKMVFVTGLIIGLLIIGAGLMVEMSPPYGENEQGYAIIAIGFFIIIMTYWIAEILVKKRSLKKPGV